MYVTALCGPSYGTARTCGIYSSARGGRGVCFLCVWCHRMVARAAAGVSWASRTTSAPWAARAFHTSVIDAAGAIYVIGGLGSTYYDDVCLSNV